MAIVRLPQTIYAVSLLYFHTLSDKHYVVSELFFVSGENPLTSDEAMARARKSSELKWDVAKAGPLVEWRFSTSAMSWATQTGGFSDA